MADAEDDDEDVGSPQASPQTGGSPAQPYSVANAVFQGLTQRGVKPEVAYGALGSLMGESGRSLNTSSINKGDGSDGSDSLGFGQWNGQRGTNLKATAQSMGLNWNDPKAQVAHLFNELDGKYGKGGNYGHVLSALQNGQSVADGNSTWTRNYEVPANVDQQVAARLAHGQALAQGAQQGTLDLSKLGSFPGDQNMPNARAFQANAGQGALDVNNLGGAPSLGALFQLAQQKSDGPTWGQRLANAGAALASISSPGQASALHSLVPSPQSNNSKLDAMIKALALRKQLQSAQQGNALSFQGTMKDGTPYYTDPTSGKVVGTDGQPIADGSMQQHNKAPAEVDDGTTDKPQLIKQYTDATKAMQDSVMNKNEVLGIDKQLVNDPAVHNEMNGLTGFQSWIKNGLGASDDMSQWQKKMASAVNNYVLLMQRITPGMRSDKGRQIEMDSIAPQGAVNDSVTSHQVLQRMADRLSNAYGQNLSAAQVLNGVAPKTFNNVVGDDGKSYSLSDYHSRVQKGWSDAQDEISKGLPAFQYAHDVKTGKVQPKSRVDRILESITGNQGN